MEARPPHSLQLWLQFSSSDTTPAAWLWGLVPSASQGWVCGWGAAAT